MKASTKIATQLISAALTIAASATAFANADVKPIGLAFEEVPASGGDVPRAAYERVVLTLKNVGTSAAGHTWQELCPNSPDDQLFCMYSVQNTIKGISAGVSLYAVDSKEFAAGKTFKWELGLPPHTLSQCAKVTVSIDKTKTLGQFGAPNPYLNDTAILTAMEIGNVSLCRVPLPVVHIQAAEGAGDLDEAMQAAEAVQVDDVD